MEIAIPLRGRYKSGVGEAGAYAAFTTITANKIIIKHLNLRKVMTKKKSYDEASVIRSLSKKNSIHINRSNMTIEIVKGNTELGNGSWGKIDYLRKIHGYVCVFVAAIKRKKSIVINNTDFDDIDNSKSAKRERKLNMTNMVKSAMKRVKTK